MAAAFWAVQNWPCSTYQSTICQDRQVNVVTTTTTVYKGKSDNVISSDPVVEETPQPWETDPRQQYYLCADGTTALVKTLDP